MIIRVFKYISDWLEAILRLAASSQKPALQGKVLINVFGHAKSAEIMLPLQHLEVFLKPSQIHGVKDAECQTKDEFFFLSDILMSN